MTEKWTHPALHRIAAHFGVWKSSQSTHLRFCWGAETISGLFTAVSSSSCSGGGGGVQHNIDKCNQRAGEVNETLKQSQFSHYLQDGCWLSGCSGMFLCFESEPIQFLMSGCGEQMSLLIGCFCCSLKHFWVKLKFMSAPATDRSSVWRWVIFKERFWRKTVAESGDGNLGWAFRNRVIAEVVTESLTEGENNCSQPEPECADECNLSATRLFAVRHPGLSVCFLVLSLMFT